MEAIKDFFESTAWRMDRPVAFGAFHITFSLVGFALIALLSILLRKTGDKGNKAVLLSVGSFLVLIETYKLIFFAVRDGHFAWGVFPFQLCSVPIYLCFIVPFLRAGRVQNALYAFMATYNLFGGMMAFIEPSGILHDYVTITAHASVWHMMLVFIGVYLIVSKRAPISFRGFLSAMIVFAATAALAQIINIVIYYAFIYGKDTSQSINMFFISPFFNTSLTVFKDITAAIQKQTGNMVFGRLANGLLTLIAMSLGALVTNCIVFGIKKLVSLRKRKKPDAVEPEAVELEAKEKTVTVDSVS